MPATCRSIAPLFSIGFSITFASLFAKQFRVWWVFHRASKMRKVRSTKKDETLCVVLSVVFLKRKLERFKWVGMAITIVGITIVGVSSVNAPLTPSISNCCCQHGGNNYTSSGSTTQDFDACT